MKPASRYFNREFLWLAGILATAFLIRFYRLDAISLNTDELATLHFSDPSLSLQQFIARLRGEVTNPLLYYWLMWALRDFFNDSFLVLRVSSLIFSLAGVLAVHLLARRLYDVRTALIAAIISCFCYLHIEYSIIGRPYALIFLLSTLSFLFFHSLLVGERLRDLVLYTLASLLLVHSHYFGFFIVIAQFLGLLLWIARHREDNHRSKLIHAAVFAVVFIVGTIPIAERMMASSGLLAFWIKPPGLMYLGGTWLRYFAFDFLLSLILFAGVLTSLFLMGRERRSSEATASVLLFLTVLTTFGLPLLYSYVQVPILHYRYTLVALPFILILAAWGIRRWHLPWPIVAVFLAMGMSFAESQLLLKGYHLKGAGLSFSPAVAPARDSKAYFPLGDYPFRAVALELPQIKGEIFAKNAGAINWHAQRFNIDRRVRPLEELEQYKKTGQPFWLLISGHYQSDRDFARVCRHINKDMQNYRYHSHERVSYAWGERRFFVAHPAQGADSSAQ